MKNYQSLISLRPVRPDDYEKLFIWVNDRASRIQSSSFKPVSWIEHLAWIDRMLRSDDSLLLIIEEETNQEAIGHILLSDISRINRSCDLAIRIGSEQYRNRGLGSSAIKEVLGFAWVDLGLHRVQLTVIEGNERARRTYEKCGFVLEGTLRDSLFVDGKFRNLLVMACIAPST
jgi:RimJ/RimL family protein N-acetyltransferase